MPLRTCALSSGEALRDGRAEKGLRTGRADNGLLVELVFDAAAQELQRVACGQCYPMHMRAVICRRTVLVLALVVVIARGNTGVFVTVLAGRGIAVCQRFRQALMMNRTIAQQAERWLDE